MGSTGLEKKLDDIVVLHPDEHRVRGKLCSMTSLISARVRGADDHRSTHRRDDGLLGSIDARIPLVFNANRQIERDDPEAPSPRPHDTPTATRNSKKCWGN